MEKIIGEDETDERTKKVKERFDHYLAQKVAEGHVNQRSANYPRHDMPEDIPPDVPRDDSEDRRAEPLHYDIGSPMKTDVLDENMGMMGSSSTMAPMSLVNGDLNRRLGLLRQSARRTFMSRSQQQRGAFWAR